jgi:phage terminase large subunit
MASDRQAISLPRLIGRGYGAFWRCRKRYRVIKGGKASKKSTTAALWFIVHLMKYPGANLLVIRNVHNTHANSTFAQLKWAINRMGVSDRWKATTSPLEIKYLPTGQRILFRGFDDVDKLASTTVDTGYLCWVWIEEAFEIRSEEEFNRLDLSVPRGEIPPPLFKQTTITFNPWSEKHWLKRRFFDTEREDTLVMTTTYQCNEFLDETDRAIYEKMRTEQPRRYAVAGLGDWGISEGLIYDRWEIEAFDKKALTDANHPDEWKLRHVFGLDYGYTNDPTAFIAMAVNAVDKVLYIYDEFYGKHMLNDRIAAEIKRKGYAGERIRADSAEPKSNDDLRRLGIRRLTSARKGKDSLLNGIARLQEYHMKVHPDCVNTIAELSSYAFDKTKGDEVQNRPEDANNHLMDAMRYAMEDIAYFRPETARRTRQQADKRRRAVRAAGGGSVNAYDFKGGWS